MNELDIVLKVIQQQLETKLKEGHGLITFEFRVRDSKITLVRCIQESTVKIGS